jgi:hypothetical protein
LTRIPLTQQWITTLGEALEIVMKIEAMVGYPRRFRVMIPTKETNIV